jgi:lysophospholipase L1-like esterase
MRSILISSIILLCGIVATADDARTKRILIVGDSWAMSISKENRDGFPAPDVFDDVLHANGLGDFETQGAVTAWGGRKASDWAKPEHLAEIAAELKRYPTIDMVHLIIGGNDFLSAVQTKGFGEKSNEERAAIWAKVGKNMQAIVDACLEVRDDIRVVIAGYDYLDFRAAEKFWKMDFHGATGTDLNSWMVELGEAKRAIAIDTKRCEYLENWGLFQYWFGNPPKAVALPGGDKSKPMPPGISPDGIHPNAKAHTRILQRAIDTYYRAWLRSE